MVMTEQEKRREMSEKHAEEVRVLNSQVETITSQLNAERDENSTLRRELLAQTEQLKAKSSQEMNECSQKESCLEIEITSLIELNEKKTKLYPKTQEFIEKITSDLRAVRDETSELTMKLLQERLNRSTVENGLNSLSKRLKKFKQLAASTNAALLQERENRSTVEIGLHSEIESLHSKIEELSKGLKKEQLTASTNAMVQDKETSCCPNSIVIEDSRPSRGIRGSHTSTVTSSLIYNPLLELDPNLTVTVPQCDHGSANKSNCQVKVSGKLDCGHVKQTTCSTWRYQRNQLICNETCEKFYSCEMKHKCEAVCGRDHSHSAENCPVQVEFLIPGCGHTALFRKVCGKPLPERVRCKEQIKYTCKNCGHDQYRECHANEETCKSKVEFMIPRCGHKASSKKGCGEPLPENVRCKQLMKYTSENCGHEQYRECSEKEVCKHPCSKVRPDCGHPCKNQCHEPCLSGTCKVCEIEHSNIMQKAREVASHKMELCKKEARESDSRFLVMTLSSDHLEYSNVSEICQVFFQPYTQFEISIKAIKKFPNPSVEFFECVTKANGVLQVELCKMISAKEDFSCLKSLTDHLKQCITKKDAPLYGFYKYAPPGDYSHCDLDNMTMIVADVLVGETIDRSNVTINTTSLTLREMKEYLRREKKDSVLITENGFPARYRVFNKNQIRVKYIIHFSLKKRLLTDIDPLKGLEDGEHTINLDTFDLRDVSNPLCHLVQRAVSLYNGDCCKRDAYTQSRYPLKKIKQVGIVVNHRLAKIYEDAKKKYGNDGSDIEEVYAYHATHIKNVQSIIETNLDPNRTPIHGRAYGFGCYFSEHPIFSMKYGQDCMFIFKLILVKDMYTKVQPDNAGFCLQLVLTNVSLFKPVFVLYF